MVNETTITLVGNLTADPELRYTPTGTAVATFVVASTPRTFKNGEWTDGDTLFLRCSAWRQLGENVAESLRKGARVIVTGRLRQRSFPTSDEQLRTVVEVEVDEAAASLKFATAQVTRTSRGTETASPTTDSDEIAGVRS
jgi:single-strand DNA-binding protein